MDTRYFLTDSTQILTNSNVNGISVDGCITHRLGFNKVKRVPCELLKDIKVVMTEVQAKNASAVAVAVISRLAVLSATD